MGRVSIKNLFPLDSGGKGLRVITVFNGFTTARAIDQMLGTAEPNFQTQIEVTQP